MSRKLAQTNTPQQTAYTVRSKKKAEFEKLLNQAAMAEAERLQTQNPDYADMRVMPFNRAYIKGPKGVSNAILRIAELITCKIYMDETQAAILKDVQPHFPTLTLRPNIWNKALSPPMKKRVVQRINGNMSKHVDLRGCDTLAEIRKRIPEQAPHDSLVEFLRSNAEKQQQMLDFLKEIAEGSSNLIVSVSPKNNKASNEAA